ncbi:single-stranded DNA-binding protein [Enterococcus sp. AZ103]|uniref:single-stranded DNA-binding protein n=1 Tax=Enterococcus sp. AZ103 TaxID=2774628 RepID=UPI003F22364C
MIKVTGVGRLTKDADLRYTTKGTPVASFTVACDRSYIGKDGKKETTFVRCILWGKIAVSFSEYAKKGTLISFDGELSTRQYEDQQKTTKYVTEVIVASFQYLETKAAAESRKNNQSQQQTQGSNDPYNDGAIDISDDDIPF